MAAPNGGGQLVPQNAPVQDKINAMTFMGLHVYDPSWNYGKDVKASAMHSATFRECTLKVFGTDESITIPVQTCTKVSDVKAIIAARAMVNPEILSFVVKQGCSWRQQVDNAEVGRSVTVKGIKSFSPQPKKWPHPTAVIGAGYNGLKHTLYWLHHGCSDFVIFDRYDRVGGHAWLVQANKTSKLQTEMASFHVWFGPEWGASNDRLSYPKDWETWPKKEQIIQHMQHAAERYGILPHIRFKTSVHKLDIVGGLSNEGRTYDLHLKSLGEDATESVFTASNVLHFPGAYFNPRIIDYPGQETFEGKIGYGMADDIPFDNLERSRTAILGNGAYAIENIRTCVEYGADKIYLVTRRKNLALPRMACWFCHQAITPYPAPLLLNMMSPMYKACGFGDPWEFHSVYGNKEKMTCTIRSASRFGIGDVTFLAVATGRCEYVVDLLKRCSGKTLHLESGRKLENMDNIIKALGLIADFEADRMHHIKEMIGTWPSGDARRVVFADPLGMDAANFSTHSTGGGSYGASLTAKYFIDFPLEVARMKAEGIEQRLPKSTATDSKPAHQYDAKYAMISAMTMNGMAPGLNMKFEGQDVYMHQVFWAVNPLEKYFKECKDSWEEYQAEWKKQGREFEFVPYPYTLEMMDGYFKEYEAKVGALSVEARASWKPTASVAQGEHKETEVVVHQDNSQATVNYDIFGGARAWWEEQGVIEQSAAIAPKAPFWQEQREAGVAVTSDQLQQVMSGRPVAGVLQK